MPDHDVPAPTVSRRAVIGGLLLGAAAPAIAPALTQPAAPTPTAPPPTTPPVAPADPTRTPGLPSEALGARSPYESAALAPTGVTTGSSNTPLHKLRGTLTPADLHFQRHHAGIAVIDPARWSLLVHGLAERPTVFTLDDLRRFPSVTRTCFIECAGNGRAAYRAPKPEMTAQEIDGMSSNSEWTGVLVSALLREVGVRDGAEWVLAEGGDASLMSRSIPLAKMNGDAILAYAQNGEPLRMANGYPVRLVLPGFEGNMCVKWLRRLELNARPTMTRNETAKYTDPLPDGTARQFSFAMDAKSIITSPTYPERLGGRGWWPVSGLAWSGRGRITQVDVSTDGGTSWARAELQTPALPMAYTRFTHLWQWDGRPTRIMSRAVDETGYVQPTLAEFRKVRGPGTDYHYNAIRAWDVAADGRITFAVTA